MKFFGIILLLITFHSSAYTEKGVVVKILPDKLTLSIDCEVNADLLQEKASVFYTCKNSDDGMYFLDFRLNDGDLVADFERSSTDVVVNEIKFKSYILYELTAKDSNGNPEKFVSYCTKEVCLDLVGDYENSIKDSITSQLRG
jgi:hypothetical protein